MKLSNALMRSTAVAVLFSITLGAGPTLAQEAQQSDQTQQSQESQQSSSQEETAQQQDRVVATVGDVEILGSDLATVIGTLPPQLQAQSPDMLVPIAMQQLIVRELILDEARSQDLAEDPEVVALVDAESQIAEDNALVQVWLEREMANAVTEDAVQEAYDDAQAQAEADGAEDFAPLDQVRSQIEQYLRQQAMQAIQASLRQDADIVFYDPSGRPIEEGQQNQNNDASEDASGSESGEDESTGSADAAANSSNDEDNGSESSEDASSN